MGNFNNTENVSEKVVLEEKPIKNKISNIKLELENLPTNAIEIDNIYQNAQTYYLNEIYDLRGKKLHNLNDLYLLINVLLHDIFDIIIKSNLAMTNNYKYEIFGGKAFERIMDPTLVNSGNFDFDIALSEPESKIFEFAEKITNQINKYINYKFGPIRYFIKNILFKYNLIDSTCFSHYENTSNKLIHYGIQKTNNDKKLGIFLHLLLKRNLFIGKTFNNYGEPVQNFNIIYYPLCNLSAVSDITATESIERIRYARLPISIYECIHTSTNDATIKKNMATIKYLSAPDAYICNSQLGFPSDIKKINSSMQLDFDIIDRLNLREINSTNHYTGAKNLIQDLVKKYYTIYHNNVMSTKNNCSSFLLKQMDPFKIGANSKDLLVQIRTVVESVDKSQDRAVYKYTSSWDSKINLYRQLVNVGLETSPQAKAYYTENIDTYLKYGNQLDNVYKLLGDNKDYINLADKLFQLEFDVISSQTFLYFNSPDGKISDVSSISQDIGSIIYMPNFLSTAYTISNSFSVYLNPMKVIYKIRIKNIPNQQKNWIILDTYSQFHEEKEILINAGLYYVIENVTYVPIVNDGWELFNMKMITMRLCNNIDEAIEYSKKFGNIHLLYGCFDKNILTDGRSNALVGGRKEDIMPDFGIQTNNPNFTNSYQIQSKPNYLINSYTVMINASTLNDKYKYFNSYHDIIDAYASHYFLFRPVYEKYNNVAKIIDTEKIKYDSNQKLLNGNTVKKSMFPVVLDPKYAAIELTGGNNEYYYKKYMKYKYKYDNLEKQTSYLFV